MREYAYKFYTRTTDGDVFIFIYVLLKEGQHGYIYIRSGDW